MIMDLDKLLATHRPFYPEPYNWTATLAHMQADPIENFILEELVRTLKRDGTFKQPITLGIGELDDIGEFAGVTNGTHRVCAHIITGINSVFVKETLEDEFSDSYEEQEHLASTIVFYDEFADDSWYEIFDLLKSFPLLDNSWVTADVASSTGQETTFVWDILSEEPVKVEYLEEHIMKKLEAYGYASSVKSLSTNIEKF